MENKAWFQLGIFFGNNIENWSTPNMKFRLYFFNTLEPQTVDKTCEIYILVCLSIYWCVFIVCVIFWIIDIILDWTKIWLNSLMFQFIYIYIITCMLYLYEYLLNKGSNMTIHTSNSKIKPVIQRGCIDTNFLIKRKKVPY